MIRYSALVITVCFFCLLKAQDVEFNYPLGYPESLKKSPLPIDKKSEYSVMRERSFEEQKPSSVLSGFDQQIDEHSYILGTGDGFTIYLWGSVNDEVEAIIDQEGNLIIPSVGIINIKNLTLFEGKEKIRKKVLTTYKKIDISIVLSKIRKFKVYALGEVKYPGFYEVNGATRVSDLIEMADGFLEDTLLYYLRGIEIKNEQHPKRFADLAIFYNFNIIDRNPYLIEGDRVFVPKEGNIISISGGVNTPGEYTYMKGDTLITVLKAAGGLGRGADSTKILVYRFMDNTDQLSSFELSYADSSVYIFPIVKDDRIVVCNIPDYRKHRQVEIMGEVRFPGFYPIQKDKTKLAEVIAMAGGLTEDAYLKASKIIRRRITKFDDREFLRLKNLPLENLTPLERSYLKTKMTEENGRVSIDFEELMENGSDLYNIILRDEDYIIIYRKNLSLKVTGAVINPGLVSFKEGSDVKYYINQAGGFNEEARKRSVTIIKGGSEIWLKPHEVNKLEAGDAIWVPEKPYIDRFQLTKDILLIVSSVATVILSGIAISQAFK